MARLIAVAFATASIPRRSGSSVATTWRVRATANISIKLRRFDMHKRAVLAGDASGGAGLDPQAYRRCLDSRRLNSGRHFERDLGNHGTHAEGIEIVFDTAE